MSSLFLNASSIRQPDGWLPDYTTDLLDLLNVLGRVIALHPAQAELLEKICASLPIDAAALQSAGLMEPQAGPSATGDA